MVKNYSISDDDEPAGYLSALDSRTKFIGLVVLLIAVFSATQLWRLSALSLLAFCGMFLVGEAWEKVFRRFYSMRWIFTAGLLLHTFCGEGRTLLGVSFLSLDGLLDGALVTWRLALAVLFSSLFCWSTPVSELVGSLIYTLQPFSRFLPVARISRHVFFVLMWLPIVQDEVFVAKQRHDKAVKPGIWRLNAAVTELSRIFDRLLMAADSMVAAIRNGQPPMMDMSLRGVKTYPATDMGILFMTLIFLPVWFWCLP